jgi:hypothetical protein
MRRIRAQLTYANVMATIAVVLALGGGAAYATTKLTANSVKTKAIKNNAVKTAKIADGAVISAKIAGNAVTGAQVNERSLRFGCAGVPNAVQYAASGVCAFLLTPSPGKGWIEASTLCRQTLPAAHLPSAEQLYALVSSTSSVSPFTGVLDAWTSQVAAGASAMKLHYNAGIFLSADVATISTQLTQVVCVYDPADKAG